MNSQNVEKWFIKMALSDCLSKIFFLWKDVRSVIGIFTCRTFEIPFLYLHCSACVWEERNTRQLCPPCAAFVFLKFCATPVPSQRSARGAKNQVCNTKTAANLLIVSQQTLPPNHPTRNNNNWGGKATGNTHRKLCAKRLSAMPLGTSPLSAIKCAPPPTPWLWEGKRRTHNTQVSL